MSGSRAARTTFKLTVTVQAHGEDTDTLHLREPNGGDLQACGEPFTVTNAAEMAEAADTGRNVAPDLRWNMPAALAMIARIADVPRSTINAIPAGDIWFLQMELARFFFERMGKRGEMQNSAASSTPMPGSPPASTSHGSGDAIPPVSLISAGMR